MVQRRQPAQRKANTPISLSETRRKDRMFKLAAQERKELNERFKKLREAHRIHYQQSFPDEKPDFVSGVMDGFNWRRGRFLEDILPQIRRTPPEERLSRLRHANAVVQFFIDATGARRFVVPEESAQGLVKKSKGWEIGGGCKYAVVEHDGQKTVVLMPKHVKGLKVGGKKSEYQWIEVDVPRTRVTAVDFHVHPTTDRPSGRDLLLSRDYKPGLVIAPPFAKEGKCRAYVTLPNLLQLHEKTRDFLYAQGRYLEADLLPASEIKSMLRGN